MSAEVYIKATSHGNFMCRALKTSDTHMPRIGLYYMRNLIDVENGESWVSQFPSKCTRYKIKHTTK